MNRTRIVGLAAALLVGGITGWAQGTPPDSTQQRSGRSAGQSANSEQNRSSTSSANQETVTGCLEKSGTGDQYTLRSPSGRTWMLTSAGSDLAPHVGHTVTVTGMPSARGANQSQSGASGSSNNSSSNSSNDAANGSANQRRAGNTGQGELSVTNLTMVSASCQNQSQGNSSTENPASNTR